MGENKLPLVSICIPTYNGENYLEESLNSAINQTYFNIEIIISDDTSTDRTLEIVKQVQKTTEIPICLYKHQPKGIGANWNNCVRNANGQYIKFLFQDDVLESNCVERLMEIMLSESNIALVYAKRNFIYFKETPDILEFKKVYGQLHKDWATLEINEGCMDGKHYLLDNHFLSAPNNKIGEPTSALLDKQCFEKVGYFNEELKQTLDCEFWSRLMPHYAVGFVDECLSSFRLHNHQASVINKSTKVNEIEDLYYIYYRTLMPYLSDKSRWKLKKRFHPIISRLVKLKAIFRTNG